MTDPIHIISLGAGVQSSCMSLMGEHGEILPKPTAGIFADTQDEPESVYRWLDWLEKQLSFPVYRVTAGSLSQHALKMRTTKDGRSFTVTSMRRHVRRMSALHPWQKVQYEKAFNRWANDNSAERQRIERRFRRRRKQRR